MMVRGFVGVGILLILGSTAYAQRVETLSGPVGRALANYDASWNKKDSAGVSKMLAESYVYFSSTGTLTTRKATLEFLVSPDYKLTFVERSELKLLSNNGSVAVVSSRWKGRGTYGKEEINDDQRCGLVFVKEARMWKLLSEHCAQIVTK